VHSPIERRGEAWRFNNSGRWLVREREGGSAWLHSLLSIYPQITEAKRQHAESKTTSTVESAKESLLMIHIDDINANGETAGISELSATEIELIAGGASWPPTAPVPHGPGGGPSNPEDRNQGLFEPLARSFFSKLWLAATGGTGAALL
jgi:hypothetical protein